MVFVSRGSRACASPGSNWSNSRNDDPDIEAAEGTPIRAVAPGAVAYRGWLKGYGNLLVLDHGDGYYTLYAHASQVLVDEGDQVKGGELVGRVGETGSVEGPRLHFEVRYQSRAEDPQLWLRRRP